MGESTPQCGATLKALSPTERSLERGMERRCQSEERSERGGE